MDSLHFLYKTFPGRFFLKPLASRPLSKLCGAFLDSRLSTFLIKSFVRNNNINLDDYETEGIKTFNQFFRRKIKEGRRVFDMEPSKLCCPCDGLLSVWNISEDTVIPVKQSEYTVSSLLRNKELAAEYDGGLCLVFRLCVDNYHRYAYADSGKKGPNIFIPGVLHTVRPIALESRPVFVENCREYTVIESSTFGKLVQMEVGAMLVGRIVNLEGQGMAERGKEKGFFEYGGSTIILLVKKDMVKLNQEIINNSQAGIESPVKMGQVIGAKL
ncbi:phosphatidylserine decarboxylase [Treponema bryantii]|uniref:phosphatidylserine decarboxylase n=1 Tax=Treponema bryantii TaxID=163 RepID=UPI0003B57629|nr:phosphatidylserine decarboxylase [Treponema bryantii]